MRSAAPIYMQSTLRSGGLPIDDHVEGYNIFQGKKDWFIPHVNLTVVGIPANPMWNLHSGTM